MSFNVTGSDHSGNLSRQTKPVESFSPIHDIPADVLAYALGFLEGKDVRAFSTVSKHDNPIALTAIKNRFSDSIRKAIQTAILEIDKMKNLTNDKELEKVLNSAKEKLATINAISLDKSDWSKLKSSIGEVKNNIEQVLASVKDIELSPPHVNPFRLWFASNTKGYLEYGEMKSLKPVISEFANLFDILPNERKESFLGNLLDRIEFNELIDYISLFDKLPVSEENDPLRRRLILRKIDHGARVDQKLITEFKNQISKISNEATQNDVKIQAASLFFMSGGSIDETLKIIDSIPQDKRWMVESRRNEEGYWFRDKELKDMGPCRQMGYGFYLMSALTPPNYPENFIKIYELFPAGEIKNKLSDVILERLKNLNIFENNQIVRENIPKLIKETEMINDSNFTTDLGNAMMKSLNV